jgi:hypothetical protein
METSPMKNTRAMTLPIAATALAVWRVLASIPNFDF